MNVLSLTKSFALTRLSLLGALLLCLGTSVEAQGTYRPIATVVNTPVFDTLTGVNLAVYPSSPVPKHGSVNKTILYDGGGNTPSIIQIKYTPHANFVGLDTFVVEMNYNGQTPFLLYRAYAVAVYPSLLRTQNDFAVTPVNTPITISVLQNDFSSVGGLSVNTLPFVENGTATKIGTTQVLFSPKPGFEGIAHLNYSACDNSGHCKVGQVTIAVHNGQPALNDTLHITTVKNTKVDHVLSFDGYTAYTNPDSGVLTLNTGYSFSYKPKNGFSGTESFTLVNQSFGVPRYLHVIASIINTPSLNAMAIDDYVYTPKNQPVTLNVRTNDIGNLNVMGWTPPVAAQGTISGTNANGTVTFTPTANFKGVATFKYRIGSQWNNNVETATAHVVVGDMNPTQSTFVLSTPMETPLVINYQLPFIGFDFAVVQAPLHGTPAFYPGASTFTSNGQSVTGNNLLVFSPAQGYTGPDEMIINYCITGTSNCYTVKIEIKVTEVISTAGPYCLAECVWSGDVNNDGIVNNKDILPLGYFMGASGEDRPNASLEWYGQYADNWNNPFINQPFDLKHADTDGDGTITLADTSAIHNLYGSTHNIVPSIIPTGKGLPFDYFLLTPNPQVGDLVQVEVQLGKTVDPALNIYGFTFDVSLSNNIIDSAFQMHYYANTWLNNNSPSLSFSKSPRLNRLESAFTRLGGVSANGMNERIGRYDFIIIEVIDDVKGNVVPTLSMTIDGGQVITNNGSLGHIEPTVIDIPVRRASGRSSEELPLVLDTELFAYPNPANDLLSVHLNGEHLIQTIEVLNMAGQTMLSLHSLNQERSQVNTSTLTDGIYILKVMTTGGPLTKKILVKN
jgi:hypothetical protein